MIDPSSAIPYACDVCGEPGSSIVRGVDGQRVGCREHPVMSDFAFFGVPVPSFVPSGWRWRVECWRWRLRAWLRRAA